METVKIITYCTDARREPFTDWFVDLEVKTQSIVLERLARIRDGNFGACKPLKGYAGVYELVIDHGPGYRVYYGKRGNTVVILLIGGEKRSQTRDIEKAYRYWLDYKESKS